MAFLNKKFQKQQSSILAAIDIGSSKICCAIAKKDDFVEEGSESFPVIRILGFGQQASRGIKNGAIVDLEALEDSVLNAIHTAEQSAGTNIEDVYVNIPTNLVKIHRINATINISGKTVDDHHIKKILNLSRDHNIQSNEQIIHVIPQSYTLDSTKGIIDPRGMVGEQLMAHILVLTAPVGLIRNLSTCLGRCHLDIESFVVSGYALALSTLVEDEKTLGATVIDIGGATTTMTSFLDGKLVDVITLPLGGNHITNDIARILATPIFQAERLKNLYGTLLQALEDERETIVIPQLGEQYNTVQNNTVSKFYLSEIIRCRMEEIFEYLFKYMKASKIDPVVYQRIIITGGSSQLSGTREFATDLLGGQVRIGTPINTVGSTELVQTPVFSTCAGLLRFASDAKKNQTQTKISTQKEGPLQKITHWIRENF
ncbi:MAG: cell division protein FtsA [Proteobacteria bacterium]|nr:cell division protein FtsA [Pseudomonadota bacterium]